MSEEPTGYTSSIGRDGSSLVGRWGGEEFVGVLPNTEAHTLEQISLRLCHMVRHSRVECGADYRVITVSVGATAGKASDTVADVLRRADALMYVSKRQGRDRLTTDSQTEPSDMSVIHASTPEPLLAACPLQHVEAGT